MLKKFTEHIAVNFPFLEKSKFYIAVSGGIDSMVLVHLFHQIKFEFGLLHCNFKLRGEESDGDTQFIRNYADLNNLNLQTIFFDTKEFAKENKISIQLAARELRYKWFYEQMEENKFDFVATAHHLDDNLETFLINLSRGTGLEGLTGIPAQNDKIFRPLLPFSREEIENYAKENAIKWREDSSNSSDKYLRNKIRHTIAPILKEINPTFLDSFKKTQHYLTDAQSIVNDGEKIVYQEVVIENNDETISFDLNKLLQFPNYSAYLYQWLKPFGFTAWEDIYALANAQSGKQVFSDSYILLKDRDFLILSKKTSSEEKDVFYLENDQYIIDFPLKIMLSNESYISIVNANCIFVDKDKLKYPLSIRKWEEGDIFYPFGMKGKKLLSKYYKDEKYSLLDKSNQWLLCSDNQIVWVIGKRQDERFKVETNTTNILKISLQ
jgi:tRNA(Ile)-lysidine synthase